MVGLEVGWEDGMVGIVACELMPASLASLGLLIL